MNFSSHVPPDKASGGAKLAYLKGIGTCLLVVTSLIGRSGQALQTIHTSTVLMSLAGSCFSSESAQALPSWDRQLSTARRPITPSLR